MWALLSATALYWGLKLFVKAPALPLQAIVADSGGAAQGDLTRLFGPDPVATPETAPLQAIADPRFQLIGVLSPRAAAAAREGVALIAVDGKPAKAYRVGAVVDSDTVLQSVRTRGASLGPRGGPTLVSLEITPPLPAATGTLPGTLPGSGSAPGPAPVPRAFAPGAPAAPLRPMPAPPAPSMGAQPPVGSPTGQEPGRAPPPGTSPTQ